MRKRTRACVECHRLKIKCDVGSAGTTAGGVAGDDRSNFDNGREDNNDAKPHRACERCIRNNIECIPAAPRLQRDRISELEAEVEQLKSELESQRSQNAATNTHIRRDSSIGTPASSYSSCSSVNNSHLQASTGPAASPEFSRGHNVLSIIDSHMSYARQQELLRVFVVEIVVGWPVVSLPSDDLEQARREYPLLMLCILTCTVTQDAQGAGPDVHDQLIRETLRVMGEEIMVKGQVTLEHLQALLIMGMWCKNARNEVHISAFQLMQMATDMAMDLGIAGPSLRPSPVSYFNSQPDPTTLEARRTWLACFLSMSAGAMSIRRPIVVPWNTYHHECLLFLENNGTPNDLTLCQLVRVRVLTQEIASALRLCELTTFLDGNHYTTHAIMDDLKTRANACAAQVPSSIATQFPFLKIMWHTAMIYIYEPILWTPTNMNSFTSPFIPGRIAIHDFARPDPAHIIPPLATALQEIVKHCHAVIDVAIDSGNLLTPKSIVHLPSSSAAPLITYAMYILVNVLVAATGPASTYRQCFLPEPEKVFKFEEYVGKLRDLRTQLLQVDPTMSCYGTKILCATSWLEVWYEDYSGIVRRYEEKIGIVSGERS